MSTIKVKDGDLNDVYFQTSGTGTELDPYRMRGETFLQDQDTPMFDFFFSEDLGAATTNTTAVALNDSDIVISSTTNFVVGTWVGVSTIGRYYWGQVLSINGNTLTMDTPFDYEFPIGSSVLPTNRNLAVDGSVTPRIFNVNTLSTGLTIDITRMILSIVTTDAIVIGGFGDIAGGIDKGVVLRKIDGYYRNYFNVKTNYQLAVHAYDISVYEQTSPGDVNGINCRYTFAGQDKHGVVVRITESEQLQLIIQDDLSSLESFQAIVAGHELD